MAMPRRVFLLAFAVVATTALLAIACRGGDDPAKGDGAAETPARDLIAASRRALREALSFEVGYKITQESGDVKYTSKGEAGYESGELVYSRMTVTGEQNGTDDVTEFLLLPPDMYLRPNEEGWFVQSPWNQGIRPDELPEGGLGDQLLDYEGITNAMEEIEQLPPAFQRSTGKYRSLRYMHTWSREQVPRVTVSRITSAANIFHAGRVDTGQERVAPEGRRGVRGVVGVLAGRR